MASDNVSRAPKDIMPLDHYDWNLTPADERLCYLTISWLRGDHARAGGMSTQSIRGVASTVSVSLWTATKVLRRERHPLGAIRFRTAKERMGLALGHVVLEDLLSGTRIVPPLNYAELASDSDVFTPCKEYVFLAPLQKTPASPPYSLPEHSF